MYLPDADLPTTIRIGPHDYEVNPERAAPLDDDTWGEFRDREMTIVVEPGMKPMRKAEILLHETLHGIFRNQGLTEFYDEKTEERIVNAMALGLTAVWRDNPELISCIGQNVSTAEFEKLRARNDAHYAR